MRPLTPLVANRYDARPTEACFGWNRGRPRTIGFTSGAHQGNRMGPAMFCLVRQGLKRSREEFEGVRVEAFALMDDVSLCLRGGHGQHG